VHITVSPLVLLVALAFLVPWDVVRRQLRARLFWVAATVLRLRLQRQERATVLVYAGQITVGGASGLVQRIIRTRGPLVLVLDSPGGDIQSGLQIAHALAAHPGLVTVRAPDQCDSAATIVACAADRIIMGPHAHLGYTDAILHVDGTDLRTAPVVAAEKLGTTVDLQRSRSTLARIAAGLADAMVARGRHGDAARALAQRLTFTEDDHWVPLFPEHARDLGLTVEIDRNDRRWYLLVYLTSWSHP
jgi:membrane-bound ClpP family serine protease